MILRVFPVVGEALHFGARRMETIMRTAWLPVVMLLILEMATAFALISVVAGRLITFSDIASWGQVELVLKLALSQIMGAIAANGLGGAPWQFYAVLGGSLLLQIVLVSSFLAPLIRLAGKGEEPAPGVVRLAFGPDQLRLVLATGASFLVTAIFIVGPMGATAFYVIRYIVDAIEQIYAVFPNPASLHTIEVMTGGQMIAARGEAWIYDLAIPLAAAAPFALLAWIGLIVHFHPKNRAPGAGPANIFRRAFLTLVWGGLLVAALWLWLLMTNGNIDPAAANSHFFAIYALALVIFYYASLRATPYAAVAVCRKSMALSGTLRVTRGFNIFRLLAILLLTAIVVFVVQALLNYYVFNVLLATLNSLFVGTVVYTKLVNDGVAGGWVYPTFVWAWNAIKILFNIFWAFFSYGVIAGLFGRLYRDSEGGEPPAWIRA